MDLKQLPRNVLHVEYRLLRLPLTLFETVTGRGPEVAAQGTGQEASQGLVEDVVGRVKQFAGIVMGDNRLVAEGQVQQARGDQLREAAAEDVVAGQQRQRAAQEYAEEQRQVAAKRRQVEDAAARREAEVEREKQEAKARAERQAEADRRRAREAAKEDQESVDRQAVASVRKRTTRVAAAGREKSAAAEARAKAEQLERARKNA